MSCYRFAFWRQGHGRTSPAGQGNFMRNNNTMSRQVDIRTAVLADAGSRVALLPGARPQLLSAPSAVPPPQPGFTFHGHLEEVAAVCFAHGSRFLVSGDASGNVFVWDMRTKRTTVRWKAHAKALLELAAVRVENDSSPTAPRGTPDELLFTQGRDDEVRVWRLSEDGAVSTSPVSRVPTSDISFCRFCLGTFDTENVDEATPRVHSLVLAVPSLQEPNMVELWDPLEPRLLSSPIGFLDDDAKKRSGMCMSVKVVPDSSSALLLLTAYEIGDVVMWRFKPGSRQGTTAWAMGEIQLVWRVKCHPEPVMALACDGRSCFSGSADNRLVILGINTVNPEGLPEPREIRLKGMGVSDVRVRDDGRIVATAGWDGKVRLFSTKTTKPLAVLAFHKVSVRAVAFSTAAEPGPHYVASASADRRVCLWEVY